MNTYEDAVIARSLGISIRVRVAGARIHWVYLDQDDARILAQAWQSAKEQGKPATVGAWYLSPATQRIEVMVPGFTYPFEIDGDNAEQLITDIETLLKEEWGI